MDSPPPADASDLIDALDARCEHASTADGGDRVAWRIMGDGPPLVLLHGGYGSWMHWFRVIEPLSREWRVACPDMPGFADSGGRRPPYDPPRIALALREGIGQLFGGYLSVALAGFSFGGVAAAYLARDLGPRARSLCLVDSGGLSSERQQLAMRSRHRGMSDEELRELHRHNLSVLMLKSRERVDDLAVEIQRRNTTRRPTIVTARYSRQPTLRDVLPEVTCPVSAIWGDADATVGPYLASRLETLRCARHHAGVEIVQDCGHWAMYEQPEAFLAAFRRSLVRGPEA